ncbi:DEAD/DEAH box helicase [Flavobacterium rhizosphaerae]|uniref:DEAD/DEAH box helicase family protein n=1 Tax=Flavobacterium rhizosphaerae TaxID=3163298 RepID=A0ABW8YRN8_9FLAO
METPTERAAISLRPKKLYSYQVDDINTIFSRIEQQPANYRLLYQLPTGGGKTIIFSELAKRFIEKYNKKVIVLTHRTELSKQTAGTLKRSGVQNKLINTTIKSVPRNDKHHCYVAMVETLKNRLKKRAIATDSVGLVIIDEAHNNSFQKLLGNFKNAFIIGVTATPLSSDVNLPMNKNYNELITGKCITSLIEEGFLAKPKTWRYDVELNSLKTGVHGDFTVRTSDELYSSPAMLSLLRDAYEAHSKNKKTLIFNTGIFTSKKVCQMFTEAGYNIRHLDNKTPAEERKQTLLWFKKTKGAILTSVSILTTGFDEPSVQSVILNRATTSLTLYHQMIGRGSRRLSSKKTFIITDLGNNTERFGHWHEPVDWEFVFENPEVYYEMMSARSASEAHNIPSDIRAKFPNSKEVAFDIEQAHHDAIVQGLKPKTVIQESIRQHALMCMSNASSITEALHLSDELDAEITWRIKQYAKCLGNTTKNYKEWLMQDYKQRLQTLIKKWMNRHDMQKTA